MSEEQTITHERAYALRGQDAKYEGIDYAVHLAKHSTVV